MMTQTNTTTSTATYTKLRDGSWGIRVPGTVVPRLGSAVTVETRAGARKAETVYRIVVQYDDAIICAIQPSTPASRPLSQRPRYRYGSGAGSAAAVAGYSSYCTDRPGCRCYDCAS